MLNISGINNGVVLDHIQAGKSMDIYHYLNLQELDCQVAIIKNARSGKMGKKDILKVECDIDMLDLDVLAFIDHSITVNVIKNGEIVEKKSRFIATVRPVSTEEEALAFIEEMKKKYWDARHNCSAFVIGKRQELTRCSDDGEPAGTAGRPMLDVLLKENIHNAAVVVTRYFGGVLLGTGGLVRAYQQATKAGLSASEIIEKKDGAVLFIRTDYTGIGRLQYLFAQEKITVMDTAYEADVLVKAVIPENDKKRIEKTIIEQTNGTAKLEWGDEVTFAEYDGEVLLFKN